MSVDHSHAPEHPDDGEHEAHAGHGSGMLYFIVFVALCVLTAMSFGSFYVFHSTPKLSWAVMMAISCVKASLVILFFMHLIWEANWKYVLTFPAMFMAVFLACMLVPDVGWRMDKYNYYRKLDAAEPASEVVYEAGVIDHELEAQEAAKQASEAAKSESKEHAPAH